MNVNVGPLRKLSMEELMLLNFGVGEDSLESLGLREDPASSSWRKSVLNIHLKDWCWSWNSNNLATWCEELTDLKRPWCWESLKAGGEGDDRGRHFWMASPTWWTWILAALGVGDGQGSLSCCSLCGGKESDWTEWLKWIEAAGDFYSDFQRYIIRWII